MTKCFRCHGTGLVEEGDSEIGSAIIECDRCDALKAQVEQLTGEHRQMEAEWNLAHKLLHTATKERDELKAQLEAIKKVAELDKAIDEGIANYCEAKSEPVAWAKFHNGKVLDLLEEPDEGYMPLYASPQAIQPLTDEQIEDAYEVARRSYEKHKSQIRGQQLTGADCPNWHFAKAVEAAVRGQK